jgi:hypothetical protein
MPALPGYQTMFFSLSEEGMSSALGLPLKNKSLIAERACQGFPSNPTKEPRSPALHVIQPVHGGLEAII